MGKTVVVTSVIFSFFHFFLWRDAAPVATTLDVVAGRVTTTIHSCNFFRVTATIITGNVCHSPFYRLVTDRINRKIISNTYVFALMFSGR